MDEPTRYRFGERPWRWSFDSVRLMFKPQDLWVGIYIDKESPKYDGGWGGRCDIFICLVPMLPIRIRFWADSRR
jgi:hypothetical protein